MSRKVMLNGGLFQSRMSDSEVSLTSIKDSVMLLGNEANSLRSWSGEAKDGWISTFSEYLEELEDSIYQIQTLAQGINRLGIDLANTQKEANSLLNGFVSSLV